MILILGELEDPYFLVNMFRIRDLDGDSTFTHFISTKQFNVLEARAI